MISETRLGDFIKFFATYFLTKVAQIISNFSGYIEKLHSYVTIAKATSWVTFGNIWGTFYSNTGHTGQSGDAILEGTSPSRR